MCTCRIGKSVNRGIVAEAVTARQIPVYILDLLRIVGFRSLTSDFCPLPPAFRPGDQPSVDCWLLVVAC